MSRKRRKKRSFSKIRKTHKVQVLSSEEAVCFETEPACKRRVLTRSQSGKVPSKPKRVSDYQSSIAEIYSDQEIIDDFTDSDNRETEDDTDFELCANNEESDSEFVISDDSDVDDEGHDTSEEQRTCHSSEESSEPTEDKWPKAKKKKLTHQRKGGDFRKIQGGNGRRKKQLKLTAFVNSKPNTAAKMKKVATEKGSAIFQGQDFTPAKAHLNWMETVTPQSTESSAMSSPMALLCTSQLSASQMPTNASSECAKTSETNDGVSEEPRVLDMRRELESEATDETKEERTEPCVDESQRMDSLTAAIWVIVEKLKKEKRNGAVKKRVAKSCETCGTYPRATVTGQCHVCVGEGLGLPICMNCERRLTAAQRVAWQRSDRFKHYCALFDKQFGLKITTAKDMNQLLQFLVVLCDECECALARFL